ncbi:MAG TPA: tetratricopeptide repeat protein, partial [Ferruginibacter sp.]|nr:tetratricopeptide repeat protein [Ferruginibacter sp.]
SRNDALLWLSRTLIEQDEFGESGGLINTLQNDQNLPKRLRNDLEEVNAYWFFKQGFYDSAAVHLEKALSNADTKQDRARWEFLLAQLYEMSGNYDKASDYYTRASKHTVDPLLDIYARLNEAKMLKATNSKELDRSIDNLLKMAKRDKFESFRDIIYYSAGQLAMQKPDTNAAIIYFNKSLKRNESNINYKNRAYLQLGDIAYSRKQYRLAASMYDSLQNGPDTILNKKIEQIQARKNALSKIAEAITNIEREDSLQRVALMAPAERDDLIRKLVRKLRREKGLKDDGSFGSGEIIPFGNNPPPVDLFAGNTRGEWYFYNSSMKSRGFNEFKTKWGNRANGDNWRRKSAVADNITPNPPGTTLDAKGNVIPVSTNTGNTQTADISYDALITSVPLTEEKLSASNEIIATNMLELAKLYQNELEEYGLAAATYEDYLTRFPSRLQDGEVYLSLYYCYTKLGNKEKADYYKGLLDRRFANSKSAQVLNNPSSLNPKTKNPEATKLYEDIYNLFIEGDFEKAVSEKRKADSIYGVNYWTPQLLYIEALNHVKNRNDSSAILGLQTLMNSYPSSPLKEKAATMIDVLRRRAEIEKYLTSLEVTRAEDDTLAKINDKPVVVNKPVVKAPVIADSITKAAPPLASGPFVMSLTSAHHVIMILDKVDAVYVNEARNAFNRYNKENFYGQPIQVNKDVLDAERSLLVITSFADAAAALQYYDKIKRSAASEISWLPANKYSFMIITDENLQLLKTNKNIPGYKALLNTQYPNRF